MGGDGGCRVGEVRAGTTSPKPDHKGFKLQKVLQIQPLHFFVNFQKFSTLRVNILLPPCPTLGFYLTYSNCQSCTISKRLSNQIITAQGFYTFGLEWGRRTNGTTTCSVAQDMLFCWWTSWNSGPLVRLASCVTAAWLPYFMTSDFPIGHDTVETCYNIVTSIGWHDPKRSWRNKQKVPPKKCLSRQLMTLLNRIITAQWEGLGDVGWARYEPALLPHARP